MESIYTEGVNKINTLFKDLSTNEKLNVLFALVSCNLLANWSNLSKGVEKVEAIIKEEISRRQKEKKFGEGKVEKAVDKKGQTYYDINECSICELHPCDRVDNVGCKDFKPKA